MERRSNLLLAIVALITLVVGLFIGMSLQGGGLFQGKLSLTNETGAKQCEKYKVMMFEGTLTPNLGQSKAAKVQNYCQDNYASYWNAKPELPECVAMKARTDSYGAGEFSKMLTKNKIAVSNLKYCASTFPFLWYGNNLGEYECWNYSWYLQEGNDLSQLMSNYNYNDKLGKIFTECSKKVKWPGIVSVDMITCTDYKSYLEQGVLSDMINNGNADVNVAMSCAKKYPLTWYSLVAQANCDQYKAWLKQGILTPQLGGQDQVDDANKACLLLGIDIGSP